MSIVHYHDINDFFRYMRLPLLKREDFYIVRFEEHDFIKDNPPTSHSHEYFEISIAMGYKAKVSVNDEKRDVQDFNLWFVSPGQLTTWEDDGENVTGENSIGYTLLFKPEFLSFSPSIYNIYEKFPFFKGNTLSNYRLNDGQKKVFGQSFEAIKKEYYLDSEDSFEIIKALLSLFLFTLKRELQYSEDISYMKTRSQEITYNFEDLIRETRHKHQPIKYYAERLNVSSIYLAECVKKSTGKTAKQIVDEYLVLEAKSILKQSSKSISEIAFSLGFEDDSNFVKYFRKHSGVTPRQYKEQKA